MNRIVKNASWIIGCKLLKAMLTLITTMLTARYLGPSNFGLINYAASLVTFMTPLMKLGLDSTLVYEIVKEQKKEGEIIGSSIIMCLTSAILSLAGMILFVLFANAGEIDTLIVCVLYGLSLIFSALEMIQYWFQAKLMSKYASISMLISYIIMTITQIYFLITNKGVYWFALSHSLDFLLISILLFIIYKKKVTEKLSFSWNRCKELLNKSRYYIISSLMVTIFAQTDRVMLKLMVGNDSVGYYSAAVTCANMFAFVFAAIIDSIRPIVFEAQKKGEEPFNNSMIKMYCILIYFSLFVSLIMSLFSFFIINIMYGALYSESILALRIIVWYSTFSYIGSARNIWIMAKGLHKCLWRINLSGAVANIVINFLLIPKYGIYGAAIASLLTQIFTNVVIGFIYKPIYKNNELMIAALNPKVLIGILHKIDFRDIKAYNKKK